MAVDIHINDQGTHDVYIDDVIGLAIDLPDTDNIQRAERAHLLEIHACCRPVHNFEPIPRHSMVSENKLRAEAALAELQRILGWDWDLCCLIILLPTNKFVAWTKIIEKKRQRLCTCDGVRINNWAPLSSGSHCPLCQPLS